MILIILSCFTIGEVVELQVPCKTIYHGLFTWSTTLVRRSQDNRCHETLHGLAVTREIAAARSFRSRRLSRPGRSYHGLPDTIRS